MSATSTPTKFDLFEPRRIVSESWNHLHSFALTKEAVEAEHHWKWLDDDPSDPCWGRSHRRLEQLESEFLRVTQKVGLEPEATESAYTALLDIHRRIRNLKGNLKTVHFPKSKKWLARRMPPEKDLVRFFSEGSTNEEAIKRYQEELFTESLHHNFPILSTVGDPLIKVLDSYTKLAKRIKVILENTDAFSDVDGRATKSSGPTREEVTKGRKLLVRPIDIAPATSMSNESREPKRRGVVPITKRTDDQAQLYRQIAEFAGAGKTNREIGKLMADPLGEYIRKNPKTVTGKNRTKLSVIKAAKQALRPKPKAVIGTN